MRCVQRIAVEVSHDRLGHFAATRCAYSTSSARRLRHPVCAHSGPVAKDRPRPDTWCIANYTPKCGGQELLVSDPAVLSHDAVRASQRGTLQPVRFGTCTHWQNSVL